MYGETVITTPLFLFYFLIIIILQITKYYKHHKIKQSTQPTNRSIIYIKKG